MGLSTATLWHSLTEEWADRSDEPVGPWLFSRDLEHHQRLTATTLGHRFTQ